MVAIGIAEVVNVGLVDRVWLDKNKPPIMTLLVSLLLLCNPNPVPAKKALELMGKIKSGLPRLPLAPIDAESLVKLQAAMVKLELI